MNLKTRFAGSWGRLGMKYKLLDICEYAKGKIKVSALDENTYISTENMLPNKGGITKATSLPTQEQTQAFVKNDVLISNIRPYFKKIWYATFDGGCSNDVLVFRAKDGVSSRFLHYVLADDTFFDYSMATSKGTKMPRGDKKAIMEYEVPEFSYENQCKIAGILEVIDEKIELNTDINKNLEQQIQELYKEWFITNREANWQRIPLSDIIFFQEGPGIRNWQYVEDGVKFINIRCINNGLIDTSTANKISLEEASGKYSHFMLEPYDIVMSCSGTLGRYAIVLPQNLPLCLNTSVIRFRPKQYKDDYSFVYGYMTSKEFLNQQITMANGSAQVNFGPTHLKKIEIVEPPVEIRKEFNDLVFPLIETQISLRAENTRLVEIRDTLLPRLISGEIDVSNLDI